MTQKPSFKQKFQYWFDGIMSRGIAAQIGLLAAFSLVIILAVSLFVKLIGAAPEMGFIQVAWTSLMRTLDAGTMGGDSGPWSYLLSMLVVTLGGVFVVSALIGVLSAGVEDKLAELRKGRSIVLEEATPLSWAGRRRSSPSCRSWLSPTKTKGSRLSPSWRTTTKWRWRRRSASMCPT
jgi:ion channel POLLUX/CASTOR